VRFVDVASPRVVVIEVEVDALAAIDEIIARDRRPVDRPSRNDTPVTLWKALLMMSAFVAPSTLMEVVRPRKAPCPTLADREFDRSTVPPSKVNPRMTVLGPGIAMLPTTVAPSGA
jgi:hypothetical protein